AEMLRQVAGVVEPQHVRRPPAVAENAIDGLGVVLVPAEHDYRDSGRLAQVLILAPRRSASHSSTRPPDRQRTAQAPWTAPPGPRARVAARGSRAAGAAMPRAARWLRLPACRSARRRRRDRAGAGSRATH